MAEEEARKVAKLASKAQAARKAEEARLAAEAKAAEEAKNFLKMLLQRWAVQGDNWGKAN